MSALVAPAERCAHPEPGHGDARRVSVHEGYSLWAATYDDDPNPLLALEERTLAPLLPDTSNKDVLDLGCGTGRWLRKLMRRGVRSGLGVDFTAQMLSQAVADAEINQRLVLGDCLSLPLPPEIADLIVCSFTIGHISDLGALAHEIARVSRPRADLFLSDLHPLSEAAGWRCAFRHEGKSVEIGSLRHTKASIQEALEGEGFTLRQSLDLFVGEPERHIFRRAGREPMFDAARAVPAVAVHHFEFARLRSAS